jgi:4-hydroxybenzoate polyprenyltransferase
MYFGIIGGEAIATGFILLVLPVFIYYLILVFWNVTRSLNKRYPDMDPYTRDTLILLFGSVLSGVFLLIMLGVLL